MAAPKKLKSEGLHRWKQLPAVLCLGLVAMLVISASSGAALTDPEPIGGAIAWVDEQASSPVSTTLAAATSPCATKNIGVVVDTSDSMDESTWASSVSFMIAASDKTSQFISSIHPQDMSSFSNSRTPYVVQSMTHAHSSTAAAAAAATTNGGSSLSGAALLAANDDMSINGDPNAHRAIIVVTDYAQDSAQVAMANSIKSSTEIFIIHLTEATSVPMHVANFASTPNPPHATIARNPVQLESRLAAIMNHLPGSNPGSPYQLTVNPVGVSIPISDDPRSAHLDWQPAQNACGYEVQRNYVGNARLPILNPLHTPGWTTIATTSSTSHLDDDHADSLPCDLFDYRVRGFNPYGNGPWSNVETYTVFPGSPTVPPVCGLQPGINCAPVAGNYGVAVIYPDCETEPHDQFCQPVAGMYQLGPLDVDVRSDCHINYQCRSGSLQGDYSLVAIGDQCHEIEACLTDPEDPLHDPENLLWRILWECIRIKDNCDIIPDWVPPCNEGPDHPCLNYLTSLIRPASTDNSDQMDCIRAICEEAVEGVPPCGGGVELPCNFILFHGAANATVTSSSQQGCIVIICEQMPSGVPPCGGGLEIPCGDLLNELLGPGVSGSDDGRECFINICEDGDCSTQLCEHIPSGVPPCGGGLEIPCGDLVNELLTPGMSGSSDGRECFINICEEDGCFAQLCEHIPSSIPPCSGIQVPPPCDGLQGIDLVPLGPISDCPDPGAPIPLCTLPVVGAVCEAITPK